MSMPRQFQERLLKVIIAVDAEREAALSPDDELRGMHAFAQVTEFGARHVKENSPETWNDFVAYKPGLARDHLRKDGFHEEAAAIFGRLWDAYIERARLDPFLQEWLTDEMIEVTRQALFES
jgi:hypothetical protein